MMVMKMMEMDVEPLIALLNLCSNVITKSQTFVDANAEMEF